MHVASFGLDDPSLRDRYDRLFESCPDAFIQQSSYWAEVIADLGPDSPILLLANHDGEDIAGLPLYLYRGQHGNVLTSVPQAGPMGGVFCRQGLAEHEMHALYQVLLSTAIRLAQAHECLALSIITNPFRPDEELYERHLGVDLWLENFTQHVPIEATVIEGRITLRDYCRRSNLSRNVRTAQQCGYTIRFCQSDDELEAWHAIHVERHRQLGATPLPLQLFRNMRRHLEPRGKARLVIVAAGDEIASGCFYVYHKDVMDVYILSVNPHFLEKSPNFANTEYSLLWAGSMGCRIYNWQSSPHRASGVYQYKRQWGSIESPYYYVTKLFCEPDRLRRLGPAAIRQGYPWHYVAPFAALEDGCRETRFRKP